MNLLIQDVKIYAVPSHLPIAYLHVEYGDKYIWRPENVDMCESMGNQTENQENKMKVSDSMHTAEEHLSDTKNAGCR